MGVSAVLTLAPGSSPWRLQSAHGGTPAYLTDGDGRAGMRLAEERASEAAGVNFAARSFRVSFGLAMIGGIMLWALALSFTHLTETSTVISPAQQQQISAELKHDAEVMSNTELQQQITGEPPAVQAEILAINTQARNRSLQVAPLVPAIASLLGLGNSFRMLRLPDITPAADIEGAGFG